MNQKRIIIIVLVLVSLILCVRYSNRAPKRHYADFRVYHHTAQQFLNKQNIYIRTDEAITPYKYSPAFAFLISPLGFLSRHHASMVFLLLNQVLLLASFYLIIKLFQIPLSNKSGVTFCILTTVFNARAILAVLDAGQVGILILFLCLLAIWLVQQNKPMRAGLSAAMACLIKYLPILLCVYWFIHKKYKAALAMLIAIIVLCLLPAVLSGWELNQIHLSNWLPNAQQTSISAGELLDYKNQSLYSWSVRSLTRFAKDPFYYKIALANWSVPTAVAIASCIGLILFGLAAWPLKQTNNKYDMGLIFILLAILNPNAWFHNYVFFLVPSSVLISFLIQNKWKDKVTLGLVIAAFILLNGIGELLVGDNIQKAMQVRSPEVIAALILFIAIYRLKVIVGKHA